MNTLEKSIPDSNDVVEFLTREEIIVHAGVEKNTLEARVILTVELPDGTRFEHNGIHKFSLKREKE